jgi:hypothetical protein
MKTEITSQQIVYFRQNGHIRFDNFPVDLSIVEKTPLKRDLWRESPALKKMILRALGPVAIELTGKKSLRLVCDQWLETPPTSGRMQDMFCFQGLAAIFVITPTTLDIYEPSSLASLISPNSYLVVFGFDNVRIIENPKDPNLAVLKKMGYGYGDRLTNEFHPIIFK